LGVHVFEKLFHNTVFQAVEGDYGHPASRGKTRKAFRQAIAERAKFVIHGNPQGLEGARGRMDTPPMTAAPDSLLNNCHKLARCINRLAHSGTDNGARYTPRPAFLTIRKNQVGKGRFTPGIHNMSGRQYPGGNRVVQGH
jgi:hypothetical protein